MKTIFKYQLSRDIGAPNRVSFPDGSRIVHFDLQGQTPCLWVEVPVKRSEINKPGSSAETVQIRTFFLVGTGDAVENKWEYIGTVQDSPFVWHLYEVK